MTDQNAYDAIVIGAGPAGLTAALYLARAGKRTLCLEQGLVGGQIVTTSNVENYPGFPDGIGGKELIAHFEAQAMRFGMELQAGRVESLTVEGRMKELLVTGFPFRAPVIVVATGLVQKLGVPGEEEHLGRGLSYCATCDGALYRNRPVAVTGSTDWAVEEALFLTRFASHLTLVSHTTFNANSEERRALKDHPNVEILEKCRPVEVLGDARGVNGLLISTPGPEGQKRLAVDGVFAFSGKKRPGTEFLQGVVELDDEGYVKVDDRCESSVPGVYAVGDVRRRLFHQVATAVGDGATAGMDALRHIRGSGG